MLLHKPKITTILTALRAPASFAGRYQPLLGADLSGVNAENGEREGDIAQPVESSRGDEDLRFCGKHAEEGSAAGGIELAEDVIDKQDGSFAGFFLQQGALGHLQGYGQGALLAFGGEFSGGHAGDDEFEVIPVGADSGESGVFVGLETVRELIFQGAAGRGAVGEVHVLCTAGDAAVLVGNVGLQPFEQLAAQGHDDFSMLSQEPGVAEQRGCGASRVAEQGVAAFQRFSVGLKSLAIGRVPLAAQKVEVSPALFSRAVHQGHIAVGQPGDRRCIGQVVVVIAAFCAVDLQVEFSVGPYQPARVLLAFQRDAEVSGIASGEFFKFCGAGAVQRECKADGLHEAGLALSIGSQQHCTLCRNRPAEGAVTAKVAQTQRGEHRGDFGMNQTSVGRARMASMIFLPMAR